MFQQEEFPTIWGSSEEQAYWSLTSTGDRPACMIQVPAGEEDPANVTLDTKLKLLQVWWTLGNENLLINSENGHERKWVTDGANGRWDHQETEESVQRVQALLKQMEQEREKQRMEEQREEAERSQQQQEEQQTEQEAAQAELTQATEEAASLYEGIAEEDVNVLDPTCALAPSRVRSSANVRYVHPVALLSTQCSGEYREAPRRYAEVVGALH